MLSEYGYREVDFELESSVTMLRPFGFDVDLNDEEVLNDELVIEEELNEEESSEQVPEEELHELQDFLESNVDSSHSKYIQTDEGFIHKAHAINVCLNSKKNKSSNDRCY